MTSLEEAHKLFFEQLLHDSDYINTDTNTDTDTNNNNNICLITGMKLEDDYVTLECEHKFNYKPLYYEIYNQKFKQKSYNSSYLNTTEQNKILSSGYNYFIKCPYCRNIQFTLLPKPSISTPVCVVINSSLIEEVYGINSTDSTKIKVPDEPAKFGSNNYQFVIAGATYKKGTCSKELCYYKYVSKIPYETTPELYYCSKHYKNGVSEYKSKLALIKKDEKKAEQAAKKAKQAIKKAEQAAKKAEQAAKKAEQAAKKAENKYKQQLLFDKKNIERANKGLPPLKRLPPLKDCCIELVD